MSIIVTKACKVCGKVEQMAKRLDLCFSCRLKQKKERTRERKAQYYIENQAKMREYARNYYQTHKAKTTRRYGKTGLSNKRRITVHFEKTEGGYCWKAWFRNPETERLVKFESDGYFKRLKDARDDYYEATR